LIELAKPSPEAQWVMFYSYGGPSQGGYNEDHEFFGYRDEI
jgi:DMSO/TMAO reductase YedYZ molybdopterin-dependent catalytic subunit